MSELKWGDKVEVTLDQREFFKRIFLYEYPNGDCECVGAENEPISRKKLDSKLAVGMLADGVQSPKRR